MTSEKVQFISPDFPESSLVAKDYDAIVESNWFTNFGPFEKKFSAELASYIGQNIEIATVSNATSGLMLAMMALFPKPTADKREVLMPAFTFAAGAESLILLGYKPVFVDIESDSLQPDVACARDYIDAHKASVVGLLFCNVFGTGAPNIGEWEQLASEATLPLIIDSAAGFGSRYADGKPIGARGDCEVFSFHATKPFAIGEGGAIASQRKDLIERVYELSNFGFSKDKTAHEVGLNAKLQELNCAIGLRQLAKLDHTIDARHVLLSEYKKLLTPKGYHFQANDQNSSVAFVSVVSPDEDAADLFYEALIKDNVEARRYYSPHLYDHVAIQKESSVAKNLVVTDSVCSRIISLPVHKKIDASIIARICKLAP